MKMSLKLLKMYFCSGNENWADEIEDGNKNFILSQVRSRNIKSTTQL